MPSQQHPRAGLSHALAAPWARLGESPGEALRRAVAFWAVGSSLPTADIDRRLAPVLRAVVAAQAAPAAIGRAKGRADRVEAQERSKAARRELRAFTHAGWSAGGPTALDRAAREVYVALVGHGVAPDGITVCTSAGCGAVFRPSRKSTAAKCPTCHASEIVIDPTAWRDAGFVRVGDPFDPDDRVARYLRTCPGCGDEFWAKRNQRHHGPTCRRRAHALRS